MSSRSGGANLKVRGTCSKCEGGMIAVRSERGHGKRGEHQVSFSDQPKADIRTEACRALSF